MDSKNLTEEKSQTIIYPENDHLTHHLKRMNLMLRIARIARLPVQTLYAGIPLRITPDTRKEDFQTIWADSVRHPDTRGIDSRTYSTKSIIYPENHDTIHLTDLMERMLHIACIANLPVKYSCGKTSFKIMPRKTCAKPNNKVFGTKIADKKLPNGWREALSHLSKDKCRTG